MRKVVSNSKIGENKLNAKSILSDYHYAERSAFKEDMEDGYEAITKRKFADHVCVRTWLIDALE